MPEFLEFVPVVAENVDTIRARIDADLNAGIDPTDQDFIDSTVGGFWYSISQALVLEIERLWDALGTEIVAAMFPGFAWDVYLDYHAETLGLSRKPAVKATGAVTFSGTPGTIITSSTRVATVQTDPEVDPVTFIVLTGGTIDSDGTLDLAIEATDAGSRGDVPTGSITVVLTPVPGLSAIINAEPTSGGAEPESDGQLRDRILLEYASPQGAGTASDYQRWSLAYPPVGRARIEPIWNGPGTVRVIVTDQDNNPVSSIVVAGLQNVLDPTPGKGAGLAPIGAIVTVATPTTVTANISATLILLDGYSITGAGGTIPVGADVTDSLREYVNNLEPGDDVVYNHVLARFFAIEGVFNVSGLTINGVGTDLSVAALEVARVGTVSLS